MNCRRDCDLGVVMAAVHREHPPAHRQARDDMVGQMRGGLHHAAGGAGRADAATLAGAGHEEIVPAPCAAGAGEAMGGDAVVEVAAQFPSGDRWRARAVASTMMSAIARLIAQVMPGICQQRERIDLPSVKRLYSHKHDIEDNADTKGWVEIGLDVAVVGVVVVVAVGVVRTHWLQLLSGHRFQGAEATRRGALS